MPVQITDAEAFDKLVAVEGERYRADGPRGPYSFAAFLREYTEVYSPEYDLLSVEEKVALGSELVEVDGNQEVYGLGGYNRYVVTWAGEICFCRYYADGREDKITRAAEQGFRII